MNVLIINCGSSSIKYQVIDTQHETDLLSGNIDRIGIDIDYDEAMRRLLADVAPFRLDAVGHRVVHGGDRFRNSVRIDDAVIQSISDCCKLAPLHNPRNLDGILATRKAFPDLPQVAVFDTAFHATIPVSNYSYALPAELIRKHGIRRYGFHGTSHHYVALKAAEALGRPLNELRLISLHLGNGASACAIEYGHSVETSMGMTPLEGLVMGTRSGDLDPGALLFLMREEGLSLDATDTLLNKKSGLIGLSGLSPDVRELEKAAIDGHAGARLAISVFVHRVRKYLGAYLATLGGADAVILTGGIGENSASMRQRILQRMSYAGLVLDEYANQDVRLSASHPVMFISAPTSRLQALAIRTNEELMIAKETRTVLESANTINVTDLVIPIAVSARHVHLTKDAFAQLFGADAELTRYKDLSQPGQFASGQTVNLVGPRNRIDGVRILGPFRSKNQVEISRTDEFFLGIDAPIRDSGRTEGSAPITLEGPQGTLNLAEGLICARRHIHMHPDDAHIFGVANLDEVEVAITGGPRDLVFQDVSVRVSPQFSLEMHIDTDEANAAELNSGTEGELVYTEQKQVSGHILRKRPVTGNQG